MRLIYIIFVIALSLDAPAQEWRTKWDLAGDTWIEKWTNTLDSISSFPPDERVEILGSAVRIGPDVSSSERNGIFKRAQTLLLSIPGHAKYFADKVAAARAAANDFRRDSSYHDACDEFIATVMHMPSPETVQVLGVMIASDADRIPLTKEAELQFAKEKAADRDNTLRWPSPYDMGLRVIQKLGFRDLPLGSRADGSLSTYDIGILRGWWEEVKSGKRTFSFKGQSVEYRFKPDGTWETLAMANPPDDGPKPEPSKSEAMGPEKSPPPSPPPRHLLRPRPLLRRPSTGGSSVVSFSFLQPSPPSSNAAMRHESESCQMVGESAVGTAPSNTPARGQVSRRGGQSGVPACGAESGSMGGA